MAPLVPDRGPAALHGPAIAGGEIDDDAFLASLSTMARRFLLRP
ncbi:hypothetical protein ACVGOW_11615 [Pseudonocardia saturnea]